MGDGAVRVADEVNSLFVEDASLGIPAMGHVPSRQETVTGPRGHARDGF